MAKSAGAEVEMFGTSDFNASMVSSYDAIAFGCVHGKKCVRMMVQF